MSSIALAIMLTVIALLSATAAQAQTKSLKLYYLHTGERAEIVFKRNGRFDQAGLKKINWFLRDWRRNEPTKMDPNLLDLVWEVYNKVGARDYIHVISGYRSPASNDLLRKRGRGVARNSQHTLGKALDFFIPGVKLSKLRETGLRMGVGGVGYYPGSGSPFVHLDTGSVRHWPRMSRQELAKVFPDGKTMHVPTDGKPLARYEQAVAEYKRRTSSGKLVPESGGTQTAMNFLQRLAAMAQQDEADEADTDDAASAPAPRAVATTTATRAPEPAETVAEPVPAQAEAPQFAALPDRVPVPTVAPRQQAIETGTPVTIATAEPVAEPIDAQPANDGETAPAVEEALDATTPETAIASLTVPVPTQRPEFNAAATPVNGNETVEEPAMAAQSTQLALLPPNDPPQSPGRQIAMLTPDEIQELRQTVRPQIDVATPSVPVPAEPVGGSAVPQTTATIPQTETPAAALERASLDPLATTEAPVPARNPAALEAELAARRAAGEQAERAAAQAAELARLEAERAEAEARASEVARLEAEKAEQQARAAELARLEAEKAETERLARQAAEEERLAEQTLLASLPTPLPAPRQPAETAAVQPAAIAPEAAAGAPAAIALPSRTVSLDRYSAPQDNSSTIGKWALAADTTIEALADVRAPAYGRNIIRELSGAVVIQQFSPQPFGPGRNTFNGKAVRASKFARL